MARRSGAPATPILLARIGGGDLMRFEVPAGTALVFTGTDGELLADPVTRPMLRVVEVLPER